MSAIELNARASSHFAEKLAETQALLQRAAKEFSPVTQASSLVQKMWSSHT
jgi:phosphoadenosine phosphosulfate reductase